MQKICGPQTYIVYSDTDSNLSVQQPCPSHVRLELRGEAEAYFRYIKIKLGEMV